MIVFDLIVLVTSFTALLMAGWLFVTKSLYSPKERRSTVATAMFALVFAFSAMILELIVCEVTDSLDIRYAWRRVVQNNILECGLDCDRYIHV